MRICIHRGSKEIGGSCVEVESGGRRLLLDLGARLESKRPSARDLPRTLTGVDGKDPALLGILVSHVHLDHHGLLQYVSPQIPVGMGKAARRIANAAGPFMKPPWPRIPEGWDFEAGRTVEIGPFRVTPIIVDHSAYDAFAFLIEADGKRLFYSGDFRAHGAKGAWLGRLASAHPAPVDALLLEGTTLGGSGEGRSCRSEVEVRDKMAEAFKATKGLCLVHMSAQNLDRVAKVMSACNRSRRSMVIDLYAAAILEVTGNTAIPKSNWEGVALFIPQKQREKIKENGWFDLLRRHSSNRIYHADLTREPQKYVMLFRPAMQSDLVKAQCLSGGLYVYSMWEGYTKRTDYAGTDAWLTQHGLDRRYIHTSGHATPADLRRLAGVLAPKAVVPIHSLAPERLADLLPNVQAHGDGEWWEV